MAFRKACFDRPAPPFDIERYELSDAENRNAKHANPKLLGRRFDFSPGSRGSRLKNCLEDLRVAILDNPALLEKIQQVCRARIADPRAQRHHFWMRYAKEHLAA